MKVLLTGCTGLVGSALVESLFGKGYSIQCLKRNTDSQSSSFWDTYNLPKESDNKFHAVIHLAGENVASGRWSKRKMDRILNSRVEGTRELIDYIALLPEKPQVFLCASAIGFYGDRGIEPLNERSGQGSGFLSEVCRQWEKETHRLREMGIRIINMRFGMILSPNGGALHKMLPPFKMKLGGAIGNGRQFISWVSIRDVVEIADFLIRTKEIAGPVNVVSPSPVTNLDFTINLGKVLQCPTVFTVPGFVAKTVLGRMANEMLLCSTKVSPRALLDHGYRFKDTQLDETLRYCINGE